jgi:hypothetical protein
MPLDFNTAMQEGQRYTFSFAQSSIPFVAASDSEMYEVINEKLTPPVTTPIITENWSGGRFDLAFIYDGNGDTVGSLGNYIAQVLSGSFLTDSFSFIQGNSPASLAQQGGSTPTTETGSDATAAASALSSIGSVGTTWLILGVIGIALVVFVTSGGATLAKRAVG